MMSEKELVKFQIDGLEVEAEKGQMLLPVAIEYGYEIPHLCYHEAVSPYGSCRLCLVEVTKGGRTRMTTSCNYPVDAGIEVATATENVLRARRMILEMLLARAPHSETILTMAQSAGVEESRFPVIEGALSDMGPPAGLFSVSRGFPDLKEQPTLLSRCWWKVRAFLGHNHSAYVNLMTLTIPPSS